MADQEWPEGFVPPPRIDELITDDGEPMESHLHRLQMTLLLEVLNLYWALRDDYFAGGNMFFYYSALQKKKNELRGPDVFVVLGTERRNRAAWVVWDEDGKVPDVIIELTSERTEHLDRGEKKRIYERLLHIPEYYIFDPRTAALEGNRLSSNKYQPIAPGPDGRLGGAALGLSLGIWQGTYEGMESTWLRWYTPEGTMLPTGAERAVEADKRVAELVKRLAAYEQHFGKLPE